MTDISRSEFDELRQRVDRIENTLQRTIEIVLPEVVGLRTDFHQMTSRLTAVEEKFDALDAKIDSYAQQVNVALVTFDRAHQTHEQFMRAIAEHFDIDLPEP